MRKSTYKEVYHLLDKGETVYLLNELYERAIKFIPGTANYIAKIKGGEEYPINSGAEIVYEALIDAVIMTKEEYENY